MKLTIWGAAQQVTGSMHLLEVEGYHILIDCGLNYEGGVELAENENFPFFPSDIDVVVLTHAHIDHSGNIPTLIKAGFEGQILCTYPTADLTQLLLSDSVNIFLRKQDNKRGRGKFKHKRFVNNNSQPLYLQRHVNDTADRTVAIAYHKEFKINNNITLKLIPTGHLLGAAAAHFTINDNGVQKTIAFTGDIGRANYPVLNNPEYLPETQNLVCESTYGGRFHTAKESLQNTLINVITEACIDQPGRLIIPAFSVGRTQSLVFTLNKIFTAGLLPPIPVFVDSPMATMATDIYRKHHAYVSEEARSFYNKNGSEFEFDNLSYVKQLKESKEIANYFEPCIIISSAGMLEGGRIQDHLFHNIQNLYATIFFIGFCARGTLGHRLLRGDSFVNIKGKELAVFATIKKTDLLSGHGDHQDIMEYVTKIPNQSLKKVFLVHGELESMNALKVNMELNRLEVVIPEKGITYEL
ncbi:MBL fold metallo-hydrolase [Pedobacter alpinus]|uniref:MBL fold metallo-hydrolase n=1 Tax=Pedobacter alpinus TaxID=1590643 RepID=A0ABW5TU85_9SPHI